jgi:hypothetical protein
LNSVLVFTPVYRLEPETVDAVLSLEWDGPIAYLFQRDNPYSDGRQNILHQYQMGRRVFMSGDYSHLMVIESDIIPPPNALNKLMALDADIAHGIYRFRTTNIVNVFERYPGNPRNEGESLSIRPAAMAKAKRDGVAAVTGGGLGCALIKRHVIEALPFWHEPGGHCDTYFNRDALRAGYIAKADMTVICGHKNEAGEILWPEL